MLRLSARAKKFRLREGREEGVERRRRRRGRGRGDSLAFFFINFDAIFNRKELSIPKICFNQVCIELDSVI
jgi:hypothetical protein